MNKICLIEDEEAVAKGLIFSLEQKGFSVSWADTGESGIKLVEKNRPHLLLLDLRLPDIDGFDVCRKIRQSGNLLPVLMLTASDEEVDKIVGLELGADDYVTKPFSFRELLSRINALLRRCYGEFANNKEASKIIFDSIEIDFTKLQVFKNSKELFLTPIEFRVLKYLVTNPNQPLSRQMVIDSVWGVNIFLEDDRTVDVHIRHLREKIEENPSKPKFIKTVRGFGYKFLPEN